MTGQHKFVLSAPGMGYDAFRTWETLARGSIPVVLALPSMDQRLFDGFPVVRLPANISQITPALLEQWLAVAQEPVEHVSGLYLSHWQDRWWCSTSKVAERDPPFLRPANLNLVNK